MVQGPAAIERLGVTTATGDALSALGGDLTISVSFAIAREFKEWSDDGSYTVPELTVMILLAILLFSAVPQLLGTVFEVVGLAHLGSASFLAAACATAHRVLSSVLVQFLATAAAATQPSRLVRVITLAGIAVFFVFIQSVTSHTQAKTRRE